MFSSAAQASLMFALAVSFAPCDLSKIIFERLFVERHSSHRLPVHLTASIGEIGPAVNAA
jgi:hypothetical protein